MNLKIHKMDKGIILIRKIFNNDCFVLEYTAEFFHDESEGWMEK